MKIPKKNDCNDNTLKIAVLASSPIATSSRISAAGRSSTPMLPSCHRRPARAANAGTATVATSCWVKVQNFDYCSMPSTQGKSITIRASSSKVFQQPGRRQRSGANSVFPAKTCRLCTLKVASWMRARKLAADSCSSTVNKALCLEHQHHQDGTEDDQNEVAENKQPVVRAPLRGRTAAITSGTPVTTTRIATRPRSGRHVLTGSGTQGSFPRLNDD